MKKITKTALILGGCGLVGRATTKRLLENGFSHIVITDLQKNEKLVSEFSLKYPNKVIILETGNILFPCELKDKSSDEIEKNSEQKKILTEYFFNPLKLDTVKNTFLYYLINRYKPDVIIDSINMASQLSYNKLLDIHNPLQLLTRYIQVLYHSFKLIDKKVQYYVKIGTTGTGGMGLNIPYTHGETQPSQELLMKSAIAGAQTQLLYLFSRTDGLPVIVEIKPASAIAWGEIKFGKIQKGKKTLFKDKNLKKVNLVEYKNNAYDFITTLKSDEIIQAPFIDSGENGIFSLEEFRTITHLNQMEFVTPEEIAEVILAEINGKYTGHNILVSFAQGVFGPSYQAGYLRNNAINELEKLVKVNNVPSVAFEFLGPPRLTKLLFEASILLKYYNSSLSINKLHKKILDYIYNERESVLRIISTGIPVLLNDNLDLIRGSNILIKPKNNELSVINIAAYNGWVDLRKDNLKLWLNRFKKFVKDCPDEEIVPGNLAAYIFKVEQKGSRFLH